MATAVAAAAAAAAVAAASAAAACGTRVPSAAEGKRRVDFGAPVPPSKRGWASSGGRAIGGGGDGGGRRRRRFPTCDPRPTYLYLRSLTYTL